MNAEANVSLATYKLSNELLLKWKEYAMSRTLNRPTLNDFSDWLKGQADIYDECARSSKKNVKGRHPRQQGSGNGADNQTVLSCIMMDGECEKFKMLSVEDRLVEVKKHRLCFCCLSKEHCSNKCPNRKQCQINGCRIEWLREGYHHNLLHRIGNMVPGFGVPTTSKTRERWSNFRQ